jgi:transposase, IS5 family
MRTRIQSQPSLVPPRIAHEHARDLAEMSRRLVALPAEAMSLVFADLVQGVANPDKGRGGMSADLTFRALVLKQMRGYSYEALAFHLLDSQTYRSFAGLGLGDKTPSASALQRNIKRVRPETLEAINRMMVANAVDEGIERGRMVRADCTVMASPIHDPSDSSLLWDSVRVLDRCLHRSRDFVDLVFTDHTRRAKRRALGILNAKRKKERTRLYRDLLKVSCKTLHYATTAAEALEKCTTGDLLDDLAALGLAQDIRHFVGLAQRVVDQTRRRVLDGETVPAPEKIVSIFEPHTDIIIKDRRDVLYGHKLCLVSGASNLITDLVIEDGNPADSTLSVRTVERQIDVYGRPPRQIAFDGGFASKGNVVEIKALGVQDVAFSKRRGIPITDMVRSDWVYRKLRNFRAGIEAGISLLKRCFGVGRCTWRSLESFRAYAWASVLAANLLTLARHARA